MTLAAPYTVLHIPHSAVSIPSAVLDDFLIDSDILDQQILRMTDWYTDELFAVSADAATPVIFPVSRLVLDPERFTDDSKELMAERGMGAIYTHGSRRQCIRKAPRKLARQALISRYYAPHHARLSSAVNAALHTWNSCLVIDCHSFPCDPLPYELDQRPERPQICLGTDEFHTPKGLLEIVEQRFADAGFEVAVDQPFKGALVPMEHYRVTPNVHAIMIEIRRDLYMDESTGERSENFNRVANSIGEIVAQLGFDDRKILA